MVAHRWVILLPYELGLGHFRWRCGHMVEGDDVA